MQLEARAVFQQEADRVREDRVGEQASPHGSA